MISAKTHVIIAANYNQVQKGTNTSALRAHNSPDNAASQFVRSIVVGLLARDLVISYLLDGKKSDTKAAEE